MIVTTQFKKRGKDVKKDVADYSIGCSWIGNDGPKIISFSILVDTDADFPQFASKIEMNEVETRKLIIRLQNALEVKK